MLSTADHSPSLRLTYSRSSIAVAAFCMQLALGSVYAWSVFLNPLVEHFEATRAQIGFTFTVALAVLGVTAVFGGSFQSRFGPRVTATAAGVLYGAGVFLAGLAPNVFTLYLTYGVLGGIGLGLGYIVPLAILLRWFPDRRGFITGLAVAGFGLGAFVTGPLATELIKTHGVQTTLSLSGLAYLAVVVTAAQFLRSAPEGYAPSGWVPKAQVSSRERHEYALSEALREPHWYLLWSILALNVTAGAALIAVAAPLAQDFAGVDARSAAFLVSIISIFNGVGRLFWGSLSDRIGRPAAFLGIFVVQVVAFGLLSIVSDFGALLVMAAIIALCYGGGFGTMPAFTADLFGSKNAGTIYGAMLTAWSAGAIAGPVLITMLPYRTALIVIAITLCAAALLPMTVRARPQTAAVTQ